LTGQTERSMLRSPGDGELQLTRVAATVVSTQIVHANHLNIHQSNNKSISIKSLGSPEAVVLN